MITRIGNISQQTLAYGKSDVKREKESPCKLESIKVGEKQRKLLLSIMSDLPADDEQYTHNFD